MSDICRIVLTGNLTKNAELKTFDSFSVLNFTLASNKTFFKNEQKVEKTTFVDCKYFSKGAAKLAEMMTKGKKIGIDGSLEQETWTDNEGKKHSRLIINVNTLQLLSYDKDGGSKSEDYSGGTDFPPDEPW